ncbi:hypothetical protein GRF59_16310 [Paenibacillus sp. HJL G12]|uniref:Uncharacterized protein n=1 Tax=Paenibacillus dendrobii TaxID=2691084 RepID=A0A7X3IJP8_9BACL|nr:hypothetical protein [Paenibacillus dendrobii]MWV45189.1 hypothetical protein [Paenibacillus dendrobii]
MDKQHKHDEEERFPGVDPIPDPGSENPSSTSMIEEILEEGSKEAHKHKESKD